MFSLLPIFRKRVASLQNQPAAEEFPHQDLSLAPAVLRLRFQTNPRPPLPAPNRDNAPGATAALDRPSASPFPPHPDARFGEASFRSSPGAEKRFPPEPRRRDKSFLLPGPQSSRNRHRPNTPPAW